MDLHCSLAGGGHQLTVAGQQIEKDTIVKIHRYSCLFYI